MTLLNDTPPGALVGATKPAVETPRIEFPYPTMDQRNKAQAKPAEKVELPEPNLGGVVGSTLSERGAALAAQQQQAAASGEAKQAASATAEAAERLVAAAAKAMGLDAGEALAAAEIPAVTGGSPEHLLQDLDKGLSKALAGTPGAKLHATEAAAAIQQAKAKTRRAPMPMVQRLKVMEAVRGAPADEPDTELAARLSLSLDRAIGTGTVKDYRLQLGLASVPMPSKAELRAKLAKLQAVVAAMEQPTLPGI